MGYSAKVLFQVPSARTLLFRCLGLLGFENICWIARINNGKNLLDTDARQNARRYRR